MTKTERERQKKVVEMSLPKSAKKKKKSKLSQKGTLNFKRKPRKITSAKTTKFIGNRSKTDFSIQSNSSATGRSDGARKGSIRLYKKSHSKRSSNSSKRAQNVDIMNLSKQAKEELVSASSKVLPVEEDLDLEHSIHEDQFCSIAENVYEASEGSPIEFARNKPQISVSPLHKSFSKPNMQVNLANKNEVQAIIGNVLEMNK